MKGLSNYEGLVNLSMVCQGIKGLSMVCQDIKGLSCQMKGLSMCELCVQTIFRSSRPFSDLLDQFFIHQIIFQFILFDPLNRLDPIKDPLILLFHIPLLDYKPLKYFLRILISPFLPFCTSRLKQTDLQFLFYVGGNLFLHSFEHISKNRVAQFLLIFNVCTLRSPRFLLEF